MWGSRRGEMFLLQQQQHRPPRLSPWSRSYHGISLQNFCPGHQDRRTICPLCSSEKRSLIGLALVHMPFRLPAGGDMHIFLLQSFFSLLFIWLRLLTYKHIYTPPTQPTYRRPFRSPPNCPHLHHPRSHPLQQTRSSNNNRHPTTIPPDLHPCDGRDKIADAAFLALAKFYRVTGAAVDALARGGRDSGV